MIRRYHEEAGSKNAFLIERGQLSCVFERCVGGKVVLGSAHEPDYHAVRQGYLVGDPLQSFAVSIDNQMPLRQVVS